ncbi:hypothetical protein FXF52_37055 [Micromonospora sp. MP36]|nr:hypothetical protein FXF52_37055 [Micromonospora sp. MP36]
MAAPIHGGPPPRRPAAGSRFGAPPGPLPPGPFPPGGPPPKPAPAGAPAPGPFPPGVGPAGPCPLGLCPPGVGFCPGTALMASPHCARHRHDPRGD